MTPRSVSRWAVFVALALALGVACRGKTGSAAKGTGPAASAETPALPPLVLGDDTPGALFTWIDDKGDFHVVEHVPDVPEAARETVRVVVAGVGEGTAESVYVADLRAKGGDGKYPVRTIARAAWDEMGASKRKSRMEALAPSASPSGAPSPSGSAAAPHGEVVATIYGASWCGPCHQAEALLKSLGVKVTKKDIEESDAAQAEMQDVLKRAHRHGGSIPIIVIAGQVFVGYSEGALRAAVERARGGTTL